MINNRQGGRRRGRGGGGRAPNMSQGAGNRQDSRQRGNAAQLLEKYKGLARDMQMQGDRVQTEYYLQFADHYFRLLNENRARFEEQHRQRGESGYDSSYDDEDQDESDNDREGGEDQAESEAREPEPRDDRRPVNEDRRPVNEDRRPANEDRRLGNGEFRQRRPRARRDEEGAAQAEAPAGNGGERISADSLPPAISTTEEEPRAPRRRTRRPRSPDEEVAPAA